MIEAALRSAFAIALRDLQGSVVDVHANAIERRVIDGRVRWSAILPEGTELFDWILASLLRPSAALCFNIPALYLMEPDEPGGGSDPLLLSLPALLASADGASIRQSIQCHEPSTLSHRSIATWLNAAGLRAQCWSFRVRLTQDAYADWLKIPVLTDQVLGGLTPKVRAERIDEALRSVDRSSWRWERWQGWTAWKD